MSTMKKFVSGFILSYLNFTLFGHLSGQSGQRSYSSEYSRTNFKIPLKSSSRLGKDINTQFK